MKKILFIMPLMAIAITSCHNGAVDLKVKFKYCTVEGLKEQYNSGERVDLTFTPYPYFTLPSKDELIIGGANDFYYDPNTGKLSFNITNKTAIYMEANSSFGGKEIDYRGAERWLKNRKSGTDPHKVIGLHLKYSFPDIDKDSELGQAILDGLNELFPASTPIFTELVDEHIFTSSEIESYGIQPFHSGIKFLSREDETLYVTTWNESPKADDAMVIISSNIIVYEEVEGGVSGYIHWFGEYGTVDSVNFHFDNVPMRPESDPGFNCNNEDKPTVISGFVESNVTYK
ncbi:MAG: hypothetical protein MJ214_04000 [Bacilli bacterium]|nr:hypothetical protein [Bacilli bacterium]